jgi:uncharacterized membrane protein
VADEKDLVTEGVREMSRALVVSARGSFPLVRIRERVANTFWLLPSGFLVGALIMVLLTRAVDETLPRADEAWSYIVWNNGSATTVLSTIASAMLAFLGVVFSITLVAMQLASQQFSPRVLRTYVRSTTTKVALGTFIATFIYPLMSLSWVGRREDAAGTVVSVSAFVALLLVVASIIVFIAFVNNTVSLMRITYSIRRVAAETRAAFRQMFPPETAYVEVEPPALDQPLRSTLFSKPDWSPAASRADHGVILGTDVGLLTRIAREHECMLRARAQVGDYVGRGELLIDAYGIPGRASTAPTDAELLRAYDVGPERTVYQDPLYGVRELVDVAAQALSPAVNAPTTAVQVIDRLQDILRQVAVAPDQTGLYADDEGVVRLVGQIRTWDEVVDLALTEIREFGAGSPQVTRRLSALIETLWAAVPEHRRAALERHGDLLRLAVGRAVSDGKPAEFALQPDRKGLG